MKFRILSSAAATLLLVCGMSFAESLPLRSVNKAGEVIDAAVEAHGGAEAIAGLKSVAQKTEFINIRSGQSRKPGPPWDRSGGTSLLVRLKKEGPTERDLQNMLGLGRIDRNCRVVRDVIG